MPIFKRDYSIVSNRVVPQGSIKALYWSSISFRKQFLNKKADISLNLNDPFNLSQFVIQTSGLGFDQYFLRKRQTRFFNVSFSYNFGKELQKKRGQRNGIGGGESESDVF